MGTVPSNQVKNLGDIFDENLNLNEQENKVYKKSFYQLQRLINWKSILTMHL